MTLLDAPVLDETELRGSFDPAFEEEFKEDTGEVAHIVLVPEHLKEKYSSVADYVLSARFEGFPIQAICGHTFVPHRDAKALSVCPRCEKIYKHDPFGHGDRGDMPDAE